MLASSTQENGVSCDENSYDVYNYPYNLQPEVLTTCIGPRKLLRNEIREDFLPLHFGTHPILP